MNRVLLPALILLLLHSELNAQIDSIKILGLPFQFRTPAGWTLTDKDSGLCKGDDLNIIYEMPVHDYACSGQISVNISLLTEQERASRKHSSQSKMQDSIFQVTWKTDMGKYTVVAGALEREGGIDPKPLDASQKKAYKARKKEARSNPTHRYTAWFFYSINDSIEMLFLFQGRIPHKQEADADRALRYVADNFFVDDSTSIDSLIVLTDRYRNEPEFLPMDSIKIFKTFLKYPLLPGWRYDSSLVETELRTTFLKITSPSTGSCDAASITCSYRQTTKDKQEKADNTVYIPDIFGKRHPIRLPVHEPDSSDIHRRDSTFTASEQHYYFAQTYDSNPSSECDGVNKVSETVYITIYTTPTDRIKFTFAINFTAEEYRTVLGYEHAFVRFLTLMLEETDFEEFYINNKP